MTKRKSLCGCCRSPSTVALALLGFLLVSGLAGSLASEAYDPDVCPAQLAVDAVLSTCRSPLPSLISPLELDSDSLDELLAVEFMGEGYTSVLFYATWCPFSLKARAAFDMLSSMFPQIRHLAIEESATLPRYGVHSLPAFLLINQTTKIRYRGPKDINSLASFYKKFTGTEAELYPFLNSVGKEATVRSWDGSMWEILMSERYLVLSVLFLCFRAFFYASPWLFCRMKAFCNVRTQLINFGCIFGNRRPLLEQAAHILNMKRLWSKIRLSEMRKFQKGARNARVWASSLASVSLGESSSSSAMRMEGL